VENKIYANERRSIEQKHRWFRSHDDETARATLNRHCSTQLLVVQRFDRVRARPATVAFIAAQTKRESERYHWCAPPMSVSTKPSSSKLTKLAETTGGGQ